MGNTIKQRSSPSQCLDQLHRSARWPRFFHSPPWSVQCLGFDRVSATTTHSVTSGLEQEVCQEEAWNVLRNRPENLPPGRLTVVGTAPREDQQRHHNPSRPSPTTAPTPVFFFIPPSSLSTLSSARHHSLHTNRHLVFNYLGDLLTYSCSSTLTWQAMGTPTARPRHRHPCSLQHACMDDANVPKSTIL